MAEGLKLEVGADVSAAQAGLRNLTQTVAQTAGQLDKSFNSAYANISKGSAQAASEVTKNFAKMPTAVNKASTALDQTSKSSGRATLALTNLGRVTQDAPFGFIGISNNLNPLLESFQQLRKEAGSNRAALSQLGKSLIGAGGIGLALSAVTAILAFAQMGFQAWSKGVKGSGSAAEEAAEKAKKYKEQIQGIFAEQAKEATQVLSLIAVLKSETDTRERKLQAIKDLQQIQPEVFKNLKLEGDQVSGLDAAYQAYLVNLRKVIAVKIKQAKLEGLVTQQLIAQGAAQTASEKSLLDGIKNLQNTLSGKVGDRTGYFNDLQKQQAATAKESQKLQGDIESLVKEITELSSGVEIKIDKPKKETINTLKNDLLREVREIEKYINERTIRFSNFEIDPEATEQEAIAAARAYIAKFRQLGARGFDVKFDLRYSIPDFPSPRLDKAAIDKEAVKISEQFQKSLNEAGQKNPVVLQYKARLATDVARGKELAAAFGIQEYTGLLDEATRKSIKLGNTISGIVAPAFDNLFQSIFEGENPLKAFFQSIGRSVLQLISQLIQAAIRAAILKALVPGSGAVGSIGKIIGGFTGFAAGGIVSGPTLALVGEGRGTSRSNPEVIAPLDQLRGMIADIGGGGGQTIVVTGSIRGRDIALSQRRTSSSNRRLGVSG